MKQGFLKETCYTYLPKYPMPVCNTLTFCKTRQVKQKVDEQLFNKVIIILNRFKQHLTELEQFVVFTSFIYCVRKENTQSILRGIRNMKLWT